MNVSRLVPGDRHPGGVRREHVMMSRAGLQRSCRVVAAWCSMTMLAFAALLTPATPAGAALECSTGSNHHDILTGEGITFFFNNAGSDVTQLAGTLNFGDGASAPIAQGSRVEHTFETAGTYAVTINAAGRVNVTYGDGTAGNEPCTSQGVFSVVVVHELEPRFSSRVSGDDGLTVSFDASGSRDASLITGYVWKFGDATGGTGLRATHTYRKLGNYPVELTVASTYGKASTRSTIRLVAPPSANDSSSGVPWIAVGIIAAAVVALAGGIGLWLLRRGSDLPTPSPEPPTAEEPPSAPVPVETVGDGDQIVYAQQGTAQQDPLKQAQDWVQGHFVDPAKKMTGNDYTEFQRDLEAGKNLDPAIEQLEEEKHFGAEVSEASEKLVEHASPELPSQAADQTRMLGEWLWETGKKLFGQGSEKK
jgi:PKD repeat protein